MYKIYVNRTKVVLLKPEDLPKDVVASEEVLVSRYPGKVKHIFNYLDMFEKSTRIKSCYIYSGNVDKLNKDFKSVFKTIEAGGGLVMNDKDQILFIFRRGSWDLPKGKIDKGETKKDAAIREVEEETGVSGLSIEKKLLVTRHTYKDKRKQRCIKKSHWYLMHCRDQNLVPQTEEDITEARWMTLGEFDKLGGPVFKNISDVLDTIRS